MLLNSNHHDLLLHDMHMSNCEFILEPFCLESDLLNTESYIYHYNDAILITYIVPTKYLLNVLVQNSYSTLKF